MPGARIGHYELLGPLGAGGMGEVYRARDTRLGRDVALKLLPPSLASDSDRLRRFEREAKTLAALNHPHIAQIYGVETMPAGGHEIPAIAMELVEGRTLADVIAARRLTLDDTLPIAAQIADALEAAHEAGIVHRDLKPANVIVRDDGVVKVLDFGLAKAPGQERASAEAIQDEVMTVTSPAATQAGVILGTAAYMSPEQARGRVADRRADIWAFGRRIVRDGDRGAAVRRRDRDGDARGRLERSGAARAAPARITRVAPRADRALSGARSAAAASRHRRSQDYVVPPACRRSGNGRREAHPARGDAGAPPTSREAIFSSTH